MSDEPSFEQRMEAMFGAGPHPWMKRLPQAQLQRYDMTWGDVSELAVLPTRCREYREHGWTRIWLPGCGQSIMPRLLGMLGFDVLATDRDEAAIATQQTDAFADWVRAVARTIPVAARCLQAREKAGEDCTPSTPEFRVHDFTGRPPVRGGCDVVLSVNALTYVHPFRMAGAARRFHEALRKGGVADISALELPRRFAGQVETRLMKNGFYVAYRRSRGLIRSTAGWLDRLRWETSEVGGEGRQDMVDAGTWELKLPAFPEGSHEYEVAHRRVVEVQERARRWFREDAEALSRVLASGAKRVARVCYNTVGGADVGLQLANLGLGLDVVPGPKAPSEETGPAESVR